MLLIGIESLFLELEVAIVRLQSGYLDGISFRCWRRVQFGELNRVSIRGSKSARGVRDIGGGSCSGMTGGGGNCSRGTVGAARSISEMTGRDYGGS